jgi:hypothetical protein
MSLIIYVGYVHACQMSVNSFDGLLPTFVYVTLRAWRANEGGTTDLPDYSEIVHRDRTLFEN